MAQYPIPLDLGCVVATVKAIALLVETGVEANSLLVSHQQSNWRVGAAMRGEAAVNRLEHEKLLSAYRLGAAEEPLWKLTDCKRQLTIILLPIEYQD